jgi:hypothetical protein
VLTSLNKHHKIRFSRKYSNNTQWPATRQHPLPFGQEQFVFSPIWYIRIYRLKFTELLGVKLGLSYCRRKTGWGCWRVGCWGRHLAVRGRKWQEARRDGEWCGGYQFGENKMGWACSVHAREGNSADICLENFKVRYTVDDVDVLG